MAIQGLTHIRKALNSLNPAGVRASSEKPLRVTLHAPDADGYRRMEQFFLQELQPARRADSAMLLTRGPQTTTGTAESIAVYDDRMSAPSDALIYHPQYPESLVLKTLEKYPDDGLVLARHFQPFRASFVKKVIAATCRENALFSITTALPDVIPSIIELPWAVAEFASDSAFLTMNQVRMAFQIAGASDREVGYREQKSEIAAVIGSAFGWRALARQVIGKIPFGGGLIGKAAVAYAGTKVLGLSLDRLYLTGYNYSRQERQDLYRDAFEQGKKVAGKLVSFLRPELNKRIEDSRKRA